LLIYISGPITGMPDLNRHAFDAAAEAIRGAGYVPINPFDLIDQRAAERDGWQWADYMRVCVAALCRADAVLLLEGWRFSRGALVEREMAESMGMPMMATTAPDIIQKVMECAAEMIVSDSRAASVAAAIARGMPA